MDSMDELRSPSRPTSPAASIIVLPSHSMLPVLQLLGTIRCPEKPRAAQDRVYADVAERHPDADVIVPPRSTAVPSATAETVPTQRDRHLQLIAEKGRMGWQKATGYNARA